MRERCEELGVQPVTEFYFGKARDLFSIPVDDSWRVNFLERLKVEYLEKTAMDNLCKKVPDEGIVLRRESGTISVFKLKSLSFLKKETDDFDNGGENIEDEG